MKGLKHLASHREEQLTTDHSSGSSLVLVADIPNENLLGMFRFVCETGGIEFIVLLKPWRRSARFTPLRVTNLFGSSIHTNDAKVVIQRPNRAHAILLDRCQYTFDAKHVSSRLRIPQLILDSLQYKHL
jgi:hypothetical protein